MKVKNIIALAITLASTISGAVITPSGLEIPESLMVYLRCPIGDSKCKNGKSSACVAHSNICRYDNPSSLDKSLRNAGYDIGTLTAEEYCKIHIEVCDMIYKYDPPVTDDDIYNYEKYFTCDEDDYLCKYNQNSSCQTVLKKCLESYPEDACQKLSIVCDNIDNGVIPIFDDEPVVDEPVVDEPVVDEPVVDEPL
ncbi:hypothetical protein BCR36DRAFT_127942 [Piromyces finnis]|uniref:Extracellular membrane protein CFEM domain-containing protein n=1 Tax=Piromyces finnis TaxID=1754191 RepID=A0A1Y1UZY0_9FUNG|nr:hypothetical protein BCR36DRAFT_127942 [Piromyces finnis]|eukprot:ORX44325.1 hypothetical protein BCR36DRAFT_127942 [Piromyces finnis]